MLCFKLHAALVVLDTDSVVFKWVETGTSTVCWCYFSHGQQQECSNLSEPVRMVINKKINQKAP